jgi:hypothetical protein
MRRIACLGGSRGVPFALPLSVCLSLSVGLVLAPGAPAGEPVSEYGEAAPPSGSGSLACPSLNPPNMLVLIAGTPQSAALSTPFASALQVALANSDGCPVSTPAAGIPVTFSAPATGAGGVFAASGSSTVTVGSDATGDAAAPSFTADDTAGSYTVIASSSYGSVLFWLTNAATEGSGTCDSGPADLSGRPAKITAGVGVTQSAPVGGRFAIRLAVTVTDAQKNPVAGALLTFSAPTRGPSGRFATRSRGSRPRTVKVSTDECGIAVAPVFLAGHERGGYIVKARVDQVRPAAFALVNTGPGQQP